MLRFVFGGDTGKLSSPVLDFSLPEGLENEPAGGTL